MKKVLTKIILLTLVMILTVQNITVFAATKKQLKNEQSEIDDKIEELEKEQKEIEANKSEAMKSVETLIYQISDSESEIDALEAKVNALQEQINSKEKDIEQKQIEYNEQEKLLDARIVALYEAGDTSYLDVLLTSSSITDFLAKYYTASELIEYDKQLIKQTQEQKTQIEAEKTEIEANKKELDTSLAQKQQKSVELKSLKSQIQQYVNKLTQEEKQNQAEIEQFEKDKKEIEAQLRKIAEEEAKKASSNNIANKPSASGYISPIAGKTKANITTGYGSYSWGGKHTGVDWAIAKGTPILAVKDGTVITSTALKKPNGEYKSYGEYIVINHHDGTMTLYAHGLPGSRLVKQNEKVKRGQQIMSVGTTGNSTGYHLHFEVKVNGVSVNPKPYLP